MIWELILGFVLIVAGTYIGSKMALRDFFGHDYYDPRTGEPVSRDEQPNDDADS
ncbi:hypothetical protein OB920_05180 [Halobacteria archaeon HArc-gm2]|nr:hypothetical protein [Halobacteria archaeon HArc-gm2]